MYAACLSPTGNLLIFIKMDTQGTSRQLWESSTTCETVGACTIKYQGNKMVLHDKVNDKVVKQFGDDIQSVKMQCDGNLVGYSSSLAAKWNSNT